LKTIQTDVSTYEWFKNEWIHLVSINPETAEIQVFQNEEFVKYKTRTTSLPQTSNMEKLIEAHTENIPVHLLSHAHEN
jgi:hypothetical protein